MSLAGTTENPSLPRERQHLGEITINTASPSRKHHATTQSSCSNSNKQRQPQALHEERKGAERSRSHARRRVTHWIHTESQKIRNTDTTHDSKKTNESLARWMSELPKPRKLNRGKRFESTNYRSFEPFQKGPNDQPALSNDSIKTVREYFCEYPFIFQIQYFVRKEYPCVYPCACPCVRAYA